MNEHSNELTSNLVNKANLVHNLFLVSLHFLSDYVSIIRGNNCVCTTLGTCYSETSE